jgi:hypothetical protein
MILQPAIIALLFAALAGLALLLCAAPYAIDLVRHWDIASGSAQQLRRERRTYLLSTLVGFVFATQLVALLLFVFNADRMSSLFVGAMCAVGTLRVNEFGFPALLAQIVVFFAASSWLIVDHVDRRAVDYPLVRVKYLLLLALLPLLLLSATLQWRFFIGLKADVITSCCGSLFSQDGKGLAGDTAATSPRSSMFTFYGSLAIAAGAALVHRWRSRGAYVVALCSAVAFVMAIAGILSFVSLYIYEHPHHHCPFCILKPEYHYQGYWLYLPLFIGTAAGLGVGAIAPFAGVPSLATIVPAVSGKLAALAAVMFVAFAAVATFMIWHSRLVLFE